MTDKQQKERRRLSAYASNDNRISRDYLKITSFSLLFVALFVAFIFWLQAFRPINEYRQNTVSIAISDISEGEYKRFVWENKPLLIYHRTSDEIDQMKALDVGAMPAPSDLTSRSSDLNWTVIISQCQDLGCQPEIKESLLICGCDNSIYDVSGRLIKGRLQRNIPTIPWSFSEDKSHIILQRKPSDER